MQAAQSRCRCGVPTLYYDELSPQFRSCNLLINMLKIELDLRPINLSSGEHLSESKVNASSTLPTLIDGRFVLNDVHTIMIYLCDKYASGNFAHLWPREYLPRLNVLNMLFYEGCVLYRHYSNLLTVILLKKYPNVDMSYHQAKVIDSYNSLETNLKGQSNVTGNSLTIADLSVVTTLSGLDLIFPITQNKWPNLHRWFENFKNMDCYKCNYEGLQKLSHLLETEGEFPSISPLTLASTSAMRPSLQPSGDADKDKLNSSLRLKFFKKFSNDNDQIPPTRATSQKSHSLCSKGDDINAALSEDQTKRFLPRIRTSKFRISPSHTDHEAESSAQLEQLYAKPANKGRRDSEVKCGVKDYRPQRNQHLKASSKCLYCSRSSILKKSNMEWTSLDSIQERVQSAEC